MFASSRFLSGRAREIRSRRTARSSRSSIRNPRRHARSPYVGPMPRPVVPDLVAAQARLVRPVQGHVVRHDHVRTATDPDPRDVDAARHEHVQLVDEGDRVDDDAVADDRGDVRVEHTGRGQAELEDLVAADDGVAGVVAALVAHDHRDLLGQEVGRLALALVAPLEPDDHGGRHQSALRAEDRRRVVEAKAAAEQESERTPRCVSERRRWPTPASAIPGPVDIKKPLPEGSGTEIDLSRVAPPIVRRVAIVWSLGRLTGRPMRHESAIADLLIRGTGR